MKKRILSIILAVIMIAGMIPIGMITAMAEEAEFQLWTSVNSLPTTNGKYRLINDITLTSGWTVAKNKDIFIDLNSHKISRNLSTAQPYGYIISVSGKLTLMDTSKQKAGLITGGNSTTNGGGLYINSGAVVDMSDCRIEGNTAIGAAGIYNEGTLTATRCSISNNHATGNAGGFYGSAGTATFIDCKINGNRSDNYGGAFFIDYSSSVILNGCTVSDNSAKNGGGAFEMEKEQSNLIIEDTSVTGNSVDQESGGLKKGGAIHFYLGSVTFKGKVIIKNNKCAGAVNNILMRGNTVSFNAGQMSADSTVYVNDGVLAAISGITSSNAAGLLMENGYHVTVENNLFATHQPNWKNEYLDNQDGTHSCECTLCDRLSDAENHININGDGLCDKCGAAAANYYCWNAENEKAEPVYTNLDSAPTMITSSTVGLSNGWYIVSGDVTVEGRMTVSGNVHLILADGCHLSTYGITVNKGNSLSIYAQSIGDNTGVLTAKHIDPATGYGYSEEASCAGIGGGGYNEDSGEIIIYGGNITTEGGKYAAGIGGGEDGSADIKIYGGTINAVGGTNEDGFGGAGIGSGYTGEFKGSYDGTVGNIVIYGGTITADGRKGGAAGIGGGYGSDGGTITISGGNIKAFGGYRAAGIGAGRYMNAGNITISGGIIKADGDLEDGTDIGDGLGYGTTNDTGVVTVTGGYIDGNIAAKTVNLPEGEPTLWTDSTWHIGYIQYRAEEPTCAEAGNLEYYKDKYSGNYYATFPFTDESLIGNKEDMEAWKNEGAGHINSTGHKWLNTNCDIHTCSVCHSTEEHADNDGDLYCDGCQRPISYYEYNKELGKYEVKPIPKTAVELKTNDALSSDDIYDNKFHEEWYIVTKSITLANRPQVVSYLEGIPDMNKEIHLIIANGVTLTASRGIRVVCPFAIHATTLDIDKMGTINAKSAIMGEAGIGSGWDQGDQAGFNKYPSDKITIHGGNFIVRGGACAAGIGGGWECSDTDEKKMGDITIYGGKFEVYGGSTQDNGGGAAIGSGYKGLNPDTDINIYGGTFSYLDGVGGAAIGSGGRQGTINNVSSIGDINIYGGELINIQPGTSGPGIGAGARAKCGNITIYDGKIYDIAGSSGVSNFQGGANRYGAAAIGSGYYGVCGNITVKGGLILNAFSHDTGAAIGSGRGGKCGIIAIEGGDLVLTGGFDAPGIGGNCPKVTITGGFIEAVGGGIYSSYKYVTRTEPIIATEIVYGPEIITSRVTYHDLMYDGIAPDRDVLFVGRGKSPTCTESGYENYFRVVERHEEDSGRYTVIFDRAAYYSSIDSIDEVKTKYKDHRGYYITDYWHISGQPIGDADEDALAAWLETPVSKDGGMISPTGHIDADSNNICDRCGETMDPNKPAYTGASLTLDSNIFLNYYLNLTDDAVLNGTMTFDIGGRTVTGVTAKHNETANKYYFACPITALEMAETVTATFSYNGVDYIQTYSVEDYIEEIVGNPGKYGDKAVMLARKVANYGHYAQTYLASIHTNVTIGQGGYTPIDGIFGNSNEYNINVDAAKDILDGCSVTVTGTSDNISLYGTTVYFDSATALNYYVKVENGVKPNVVCAGKDFKITEYKGYTPTASEKVYIISVKGITATELDDNIAVTVNDNLIITGSVLAYCKAVMNKEGQTETAKNAMAAFYEYHKAAVDYVTPQA